jgi:hypothetical protein
VSVFCAHSFLYIDFYTLNFNDYPGAFITLFSCLHVSDFDVITNGFVAVTSKYSRIYFTFWYVLGTLLMLNVLKSLALVGFLNRGEIEKPVKSKEAGKVGEMTIAVQPTAGAASKPMLPVLQEQVAQWDYNNGGESGHQGDDNNDDDGDDGDDDDAKPRNNSADNEDVILAEDENGDLNIPDAKRETFFVRSQVPPSIRSISKSMRSEGGISGGNDPSAWTGNA